MEAVIRKMMTVAVCVHALLPIALMAQSAVPTVRVDYNMSELARAPALTKAQLSGRKRFAQYCAICHDPVGQPSRTTYGPPLGRELLEALGEDRVRTSVLKGTARMPGFQYQFKPTELDELMAYLKTASLLQASPTSAAVSPSPTTSASVDARAAREALLRGSVRTPGGASLEGVAVSARMVGTTVTTTVFTDGAGEYRFPALGPGHYLVWAQATGYATAQTEIELSAKRPRQLALRLAALRDPADVLPQLSAAEWLEALPARTREDKRLKEIFRLNCTECHAASFVLQRRFDEQGWRTIIRFMRQVSHFGWKGPSEDTTVNYEGNATDAISHYEDELTHYLTRVSGPTSPALPVKLLPRPTGAAAQILITAYNIPPAETPTELAWHDGSEWDAGAAAGMHGASGVHDVIIDQKGNAWLTESVDNDARTLIKLEPATGQVTGFRLPARPKDASPGSPWQAGIAHGIAQDSKGQIWFGSGRTLAKLDPHTELFQIFTPPKPIAEQMLDTYVLTVDVDAKDKIWLSAAEGVVRFDPSAQQFSHYPNPPGDIRGPTYGMAGDAAGNGWWSTPWTNDRVTVLEVQSAKTHDVMMRPPWAAAEEALATPADRKFAESPFNWLPGVQFPRRPGADRRGKTVWVPNYLGRNLAEVDIQSHAVKYHELPLNSGGYFVAVDKHHVVWTNLIQDDRVAAFDPRSQQWTLYRLPVNRCESRHITVDDRTGDVWVPCWRASKVLRLQFPRASD